MTLADGQVFAVASHLHETDFYNARHNNNTPERYSAAGDYWHLLASGHTAPESVDSDSYPRYHLLPSGPLFCDTAGDDGAQQHVETSAGLWAGDDVDTTALPGYYARGSSATSVVLPLLPPNYRPRIVAFNSPHATTFRIDPAENDPVWVGAANRQGDAGDDDRQNGCATKVITSTRRSLSFGRRRSLCRWPRFPRGGNCHFVRG